MEENELEEINKKLKKINNKAEIIPVENCEIEQELVLGLEVGEREIEKPEPHRHEYESFVYHGGKMNDKLVEEFLIATSALRIKGFVNNGRETFLLSCVNGRCTVEAWKTISKKSKLVFIGKHLDKEKIKSCLDKLVLK